jgi:hypothetical protein
MTISKTIAGLISPTLVAIAAGMLLNIGSFPALAKQVSRDPALIFVSGILLFIAGLAIVRVHNRWTNGWPVLVTILGRLFVLGLGALPRSRHIDVIDHALHAPIYLASSMSLTAVCRVVSRTPLGPSVRVRYHHASALSFCNRRRPVDFRYVPSAAPPVRGGAICREGLLFSQ